MLWIIYPNLHIQPIAHFLWQPRFASHKSIVSYIPQDDLSPQCRIPSCSFQRLVCRIVFSKSISFVRSLVVSWCFIMCTNIRIFNPSKNIFFLKNSVWKRMNIAFLLTGHPFLLGHAVIFGGWHWGVIMHLTNNKSQAMPSPHFTKAAESSWVSRGGDRCYGWSTYPLLTYPPPPK